MKEYIEREALMFNIAAKFEKHYGKSREQSIHDFYKFVIKKICAAPAADVVEVRHAKWEKRGHKYQCTGCKVLMSIDGTPEENLLYYCPNCGAKMDKLD